MAYRVTLIPGDGIGPELTEQTVRCVAATGVQVDWERVETGQDAFDKYGTPLPEATLDSIRRNRVGLKGPITTPVGSGFRSVNVGLRMALTLFANLRPAKSYKGIPSRYKDIDLVVVRENTEGLYSGIEHWVGEDHNAAEGIKIITRKGSERVIRFAFEFAKRNGRKKVTCVHKANIQKITDGFFLDIFREVAQRYPGIEAEDRIIDNMSMQLVVKPELYDVIVTMNLYGDIISDLCAGLVGGLGVAPAGNYGDGDCVVFEPVHGSAPKYAGQNKANPMAMILSAAMMLRHLGEKQAGDNLERAVADVVAEGKYTTYDLGGKGGTSDFGKAVADRVAALRS